MLRPGPAGPRWLVLPVFAGLLLGAAGTHPALWALAWAGIAAFSGSLARATSLRRALLGLAIGRLLTNAIWLHWAFAMTATFFSAPARIVAIGAGFIVVQMVPNLGALALGAWLSRGRLAVRFWLPPLWALGELLLSLWTHIANDWLFTQAQVQPVLRLLGRIGMWPTLIACLFIAASLGEAVALGQRRAAWPALALIVGLCLLPPLPTGDPQALAGIGAVHMTSEFMPPQVRGDGIRLVVWPETAFAERPPVGEGPVAGSRFDVPLGGPRTSHLAGVITLLPQGQQNSAVAVEPDGVITGSRAKRILFPMTEGTFLGLGEQRFQPGRRVPLLQVGGRKVIALICFEYMTRELIRDGRAAGGELLAVLAGDSYQAGSEVAQRQVMAHIVLRAVEFGLPVVYASRGSRSFFVAPDGRILARSERQRSGVLSWSPQYGSRDDVPVPAPTTAVLYSQHTPWLRPDCPPGSCSYHPLEGFRCPPVGADTVIVAGHGGSDTQAGQSPAALAQAVACFRPQLIVLDTCFGASTPVLRALAARSRATVVAPPFPIGQRGLHYSPRFFAGLSATERATAIQTQPARALLRWPLDGAALATAEATAAALDAAALRRRLRSWVPTLVAIEVAPGQEVLVAVDWRRVGPPLPGPSGP